MLIIEVCKQFGWDYYTYMSQPNWFIKMIIEAMIIDKKRRPQKGINL